MSVTRIATRYAKSLLDLAIEQGKLEAVAKDMNALGGVVHHPDMKLMLKSPIISSDKKNAALNAVMGGQLDSLTTAYISLLVNKGREPYLAEIVTEFKAQYKFLNKITSIKVTTAAPMSDAVLADLKVKIIGSGVTNANLDIETSVDPALIGGFVLEFDSKRYDASVAHKLEQLKAQFSKNLYVKEF